MEARSCTTQTFHSGYLPAITEEERAEALKYHSKCMKSAYYQPVREPPIGYGQYNVLTIRKTHAHTLSELSIVSCDSFAANRLYGYRVVVQCSVSFPVWQSSR